MVHTTRNPASSPSPLPSPPRGRGLVKHVVSSRVGHGHDEITCGYGNPLKASTQAEMCVKAQSGAMSMTPLESPPANRVLTFVGAPKALLNLFTKAEMSPVSGCGSTVGGLRGVSTSPIEWCAVAWSRRRSSRFHRRRRPLRREHRREPWRKSSATKSWRRWSVTTEIAPRLPPSWESAFGRFITSLPRSVKASPGFIPRRGETP